MKIYINDIPVEIVSLKKLETPDATYDVVIDGSQGALDPAALIDHVLVRHASKEHIEQLLEQMTRRKFKNLDSITFGVQQKKEVQQHLKSKFTVVKAAGGVVCKGDRILLIYRLGKWDLPKGKLDNGESWGEGALREVEEETGVQVQLGERICKTWHTYLRNGKFNLKKTVWYRMDMLDDSAMAPQTEEDIDEVRFMDHPEVTQAMYNSYRTIRYVLKQFYLPAAQQPKASGDDTEA